MAKLTDIEALLSLTQCVCVCCRSVTMTTKRGLITDSFKVVKKAKKEGKREKRPPPPPPPQQGEEQGWCRLSETGVHCLQHDVSVSIYETVQKAKTAIWKGALWIRKCYCSICLVNVRRIFVWNVELLLMSEQCYICLILCRVKSCYRSWKWTRGEAPEAQTVRSGLEIRALHG